MKKFKFVIRKILIIIIIFLSTATFAQGLPTDDGDVTDNPAPITGLIPLAVLVGAGIGIYGLNKKKNK
ncbi:hypothetical protein [Mesonia sp.]|uniref:hypothetical protein n=1 Tax=Mesonia sp. TaxID=1960830 RepID=UPI00177067D5|nr:hypothetical protein [Mesonia sp.]HIB36261.1 hypothetical protein [Mesonia sp.]HIO27676.1 hypothetical protein [Flavobacteriaceae bacterium]